MACNGISRILPTVRTAETSTWGRVKLCMLENVGHAREMSLYWKNQQEYLLRELDVPNHWVKWVAISCLETEAKRT